MSTSIDNLPNVYNTKTLPLVSVIIPTYNQESYIADAIESALKQDYPNLEIVIADDCSSDGTSKAIERYLKEPKVRYHRNPRNLGRVGNYHQAAHDLASGEWVVNLDGDDYFTSSDFISTAIRTILEVGKNDIEGYCYGHNIGKIEQTIHARRLTDNAILVSGKDYFINYYKYGGFGHLNTIYRRETGLNIGMYTLPCQASDFHSIMRIFLHGHIILDNREIGYWRVHQNNATILGIEQKLTEARDTFNGLEQYAKDFFSEEELKEWRENMDRMARQDYISTRVRRIRDLKSLRLLLAHPSFTREYVRNWYGFIFNR